MNKSDAGIANRIILATAVIFIGALLWIIVVDAITQFFGVSITGKLWLGLVFGSAVVTDKIYKIIAKHKAGASNVQDT
jgi:hypothetical protein